MTIKTFKSFFSEADAKDYIAPKDSDDEVKNIKPRSKGEVDFKKSHKMTHTKHPVAGDHQFDGSIKGINEDVELNEKSYKQVFDLKKGSARGRAFLYTDGEYVAYFTGNGETSVGIPGNKLDKKWLKTKLDKFSKSGLIGEEVEVNEDVWSDLQTIVKKKSSQKIKFANGKTETVDMQTANLIVTVLNKLKPANKKKSIDLMNKTPEGFMKVLDIVHKA